MHIRYKVVLTEEERGYLERFTSQGKVRARALKRAQVLLLADGGSRREAEVVEALGVSTSTVYRVKRDFVEYGLEAALSEGPRSGQPRKTGAHEDALLVSIACSTPPAGRCRWTLSLLAERYTPRHASWLNMVEIEIGNMNRQCLDRRLDSMDLLESELAAWETRRNEERASINWMFDVDKARSKLHRAYDKLTGQN